jgi:cytosine/adenosine deaminase-related metal-dependent hydrolase
MHMRDQSLAVRARWCLVHDGERARVETDRWIVVEGGKIAAIAAERPGQVDLAIDRPDLLVLPGLIDLHNHVFTEMMVRGLTEDMPSAAYETTLIYGLLMPIGQLAMRQLSADEIGAVADLGLMQLIKSGVTTLMEPFRAELTPIFVAAAERAGLRFYAAPYLFSTPNLSVGADGKPDYGSGSEEADAIEEWRGIRERYHGGGDGRIEVVLSPHGTDTCGPDLLREVRRLADETGALLTTHLAQSRAEVDIIRERYGRTPPEYLDWVGVLGRDALLAHCIYASDDDLDLIARAGSTVLHCPRSFSRGGVSALFERFRRRGLRTVVATDGYNLDIIGELRAAGIVSKLAFGESGVATAAQLVDAVTTVAAAALQRSDIGRIAPGARADLVAVDLGRPNLRPVSDPLKALVWRASAHDVWATVVGGRALVNEGRYPVGDEARITEAGAAAVEKVWRLRAAAGRSEAAA